MGQTHYQILGVEPSASAEEIKKAFKAAAKATHPDHHPDDPGAEERFKLVSAAWEVLQDADKRQAYDAELARPPPPPPPPPPARPPPPRQRQPWDDVQRTAPASEAADPGECHRCRIAQRQGRLRCHVCQAAHEQFVAGVQSVARSARRAYAPLAPRMQPLEHYWRNQVVLEDAFGHLGVWGRDGLPRW